MPVLPFYRNQWTDFQSKSVTSLLKDFFIIQETAGSWFVLDYERQPHQIEYIL